MHRIRLFALSLSMALLMTGLAPARVSSAPPPPDLSPQVIGGDPVAPGEWPWLVALLDAGVPAAPLAQFCGGALIDDGIDPLTTTRWVLTAAHCFPDVTAEQVQVLVGQQDLSAATPEQRVDVTRIVAHPLFTVGSNSNNDIALLELATPVTDVTPIRIARQSDAARFTPGTVAWVAGWGNTNELQDVIDLPTRARAVAIPLISNDECNLPYQGEINEAKICAAQLPDGGVDSCQGDSGGPLMVPDGTGGWLHVGVVSYGTGCGWANFAGVYARTAFFDDWVDGVLAGDPQLDVVLEGASVVLEGIGTLPQFSVAAPAEPFTKTLHIANSGLVMVEDALAEVAVPPGVAVVEGGISDDGQYDATQRIIRWDVGALEPLSTTVVTFQLTAPATFMSGAYGVRATAEGATVTAAGRLPVVTRIDEPVIYALANPERSSIRFGEEARFALAVVNFGRGPSAASQPLTMRVRVPSALTDAMAVDGEMLPSGVATWKLGQIPPETVVVHTLAGIVEAPEGPGALEQILSARITSMRVIGPGVNVQGVAAQVLAQPWHLMLPVVGR